MSKKERKPVNWYEVYRSPWYNIREYYKVSDTLAKPMRYPEPQEETKKEEKKEVE